MTSTCARNLDPTSGECDGRGERSPAIARNGTRCLPPGARHGAVVLTSSHTAATGGSDRRTAMETSEPAAIGNVSAKGTQGGQARRGLASALMGFPSFRDEGSTPAASTTFPQEIDATRSIFPPPPLFLHDLSDGRSVRLQPDHPATGSQHRAPPGSSACSAVSCPGHGVRPVPGSPLRERHASRDANRTCAEGCERPA